MARRRARTVCSVPGCPTLTNNGRCEQHRREAEQARGSALQRGYGGPRWHSARQAVLARDPWCVLGCGRPSTVADHWPVSRRDLLAAGVADPDAPHRMRGLCRTCHSRETAKHQPGGWHQ